uniref:Ac106 n=1 Tax=Nesodiprion zhejiangensis nucleopolyhedrovirus TaxID=3135970 RepID=A0AAN0LI44_9BACU
MSSEKETISETRVSVDEFKRMLLIENINNLIDKNEIIVGNVRDTIETAISEFKQNPTDVNYKQLKTMFDKVTFLFNEISEINWERMLAKIFFVVFFENTKRFVKSKNPRTVIDTFLSQLNNTSVCIEDDPNDLIKLYNSHLDLMDMKIEHKKRLHGHHLIDFVKKLVVNCVKAMHNDSRQRTDITDYDIDLYNNSLEIDRQNVTANISRQFTETPIESRKRHMEYFLDSNKRARV